MHIFNTHSRANRNTYNTYITPAYLWNYQICRLTETVQLNFFEKYFQLSSFKEPVTTVDTDFCSWIGTKCGLLLLLSTHLKVVQSCNVLCILKLFPAYHNCTEYPLNYNSLDVFCF